MQATEIPTIIAGPIIRKLTPHQMVLWLVTPEPLQARVELYDQQDVLFSKACGGMTRSVRVGESAWIHLIDIQLDQALPEQRLLHYDLRLSLNGGEKGLADLVPHLLYENESRPGFVLKTHLDHILHGSCRKPHYDSHDALLRVDQVIAESRAKPADSPALLMMSGDQIYADDVAGPMLSAIHQVIQRLGLYTEQIEGATVTDAEQLYRSEHCYYQREELLPHTEANQALQDRFFGGARKPIFTADTAHNHLITLSEVLAMYFLVWSPQLWAQIKLNITDVTDKHADRYLEEQRVIENFSKGLPQVQRALAHLPVYMIFDDHDVTDDWNLTRGWEEAAYDHPFSRRIIGNALIGYWLCQGWGNAPQHFPDSWLDMLQQAQAEQGNSTHNQLVTEVLSFEQWSYSLDAKPRLVVLDTRTRRWRSESSLAKPSGLMDWEALSELQSELMGQDSVLLVSPAPIFGMKLVETVQRIFTFFGHALMVDAENWMAHKGSASVILNIFRHRKTPQHFVILSGDVHYSFVYDVKLRFRKNSPDIWQITCSGFKNEFPHKLLNLFDRLNRFLYGSRSPLNWLTKRRRMQIRSRIPQGLPEQRVVNSSAVGQIYLDSEGRPERVAVLPAAGGSTVFPPRTDK